MVHPPMTIRHERRWGLFCFLAALAPLATSTPASAQTTGPAIPVARTAAILPIRGELNDITVTSLTRRVEQAKSQGVSVIVFDLDTPGGLVSSSIALADLIKNDLTDIKTVAWVNPNAYSGGTIIAVACDEIVMARSSRMGDSQPIMIGPGGAAAVDKTLQPKAYTPVLSEFRHSCRLNGYDQSLCEAFVLPEREVWWIEHKESGERKFVFKDEKIKLVGGDDTDNDAPNDAVESPGTSKTGGSVTPREPKWKLVERYFDAQVGVEVDTIQPVVRDDQLLEMSAGEAIAYGFCKGIVADEDSLQTRFDVASLVRIERTWSESLAYWLTSMYVRGFLLVIIMLGAYVEFHTPGVGVPGLVALVCLAVFVGAPFLAGLANMWELLFIALGFGLIVLEVFVIPGFGIAGISGLVFVIIGVLATFVPDEPGRSFPLYIPTLPGSLHYLKMAMLTFITSMAVSVVGMVMLSRFLPRMPFFRQIVPANPTPSEVRVEDPYRGLARVGDLGEAFGPLRPAGKARFGSMLVDVVTQGEFLEASAQLEVVERRGNRVVVRAKV